ncbi:MAG: 2Fe-2S iron-sulfur cluster binding domain-containing protein [Zymomonas mobilis]|uniref:2Fe-2S iron-sulfur cluster-binding protein n=1 Tax=Zymomonas mobilis TaxID=542 RepID=UPI0011533DA9|nr:2Fe-2S iron-sulfur cluster binding domain-containing protein [Zymomonas mobilis]
MDSKKLPVSESSVSTKEDNFEIKIASSGEVIPVRSGQTIADALEHAGIETVIACEQGVCGACMVGLVLGEADHRDHIQSDAEKAQNKEIAICCSRAHSARLVLDL